MKKFGYLVIAALAVLTASCQKEPDSLTINKKQMEVGSTGGSESVTLTTNTKWAASATESWISVSPASGDSGTVTVTITVAENSTYDVREGKVLFTAGTASEEFTVTQNYARVFEAGDKIEIDCKEQSFKIKVNSNMSYTTSISADWITSASTKAAPVESTLEFAVAANNAITARSAEITVTAENGQSATIPVTQGPSYDAIELAGIKNIGSSMMPYDFENWLPANFEEVVLTFNNAKGQVNIAINLKDASKLSGEYELDAAANHAVNTFSIKGTSYQKYYTNIVEDGKEIAVADGLVAIEDNGDQISVNAQLMDESETIYTYSYEGPKGEVSVDNIGAIASESYYADYYTHFTTKAKEHDISLYVSSPVSDGGNWVYSLGLKLYGDVANDGKSIPLGKYTFAESGLIDETVTYKSGNYAYAVGTFTSGGGYANYDFEAQTYNYIEVQSGTVEVTQGSVEGTYNYDLNLVIKPYTYDEDYNTVYGDEFTYAYKFEDVSTSFSDTHVDPIEDGDFEVTGFSTNNQSIGYFVGDVYGNGGSVMGLGWQYANNIFNITLTLQSATPYVFEKNFNGRYCNTPFPAGTYTFAADSPSDADGKPLNAICNVKTLTFISIANTYTGTTYKICGGSLTLADDSVTFNLEASYTDPAGEKQIVNVTGTVESTLYYARDYSANASYLSRFAWAQ